MDTMSLNKRTNPGRQCGLDTVCASFFDLSALRTMRHRTDADKELKGKCDEDLPSRVTVVAVVVLLVFDPGSLSVAQAGLVLSIILMAFQQVREQGSGSNRTRVTTHTAMVG